MISVLFSNPVQFFGWLFAFLIAIMSHEVAHGFVALKNGDPTAKINGRLNFNPAKHFDPIGVAMFILLGFGYAKPVPIDPNNFQNYKKGVLTVSLAGVTTNLLLAIVAYPLFTLCVAYFPDFYLFDEFFCYFLLYLFYVDIWLMVFNLLPIYPLDGFRVIELFAPQSGYVRFMYHYSRYVLLGYLLISVLGSRLNIPFLNIVSFLSKYVIDAITALWGLIL